VLLVAAAAIAVLPAAASAQKRQRDLITRQEIEASPKRSGNLLQLIRSLRPHFLEPPRGTRGLQFEGTDRVNQKSGSGSSMIPVAVFIGNNQQSGVDALESLMADQVEEVRYLDASKAIGEFGLSRGAGGAIILKLTSQGKPDR
jgi:hypothetical protein